MEAGARDGVVAAVRGRRGVRGLRAARWDGVGGKPPFERSAWAVGWRRDGEDGVGWDSAGLNAGTGVCVGRWRGWACGLDQSHGRTGLEPQWAGDRDDFSLSENLKMYLHLFISLTSE